MTRNPANPETPGELSSHDRELPPRVTTDRYTLAAVPERLRIAVGQVEKLQQPKKVAVSH